MDPALAITLLDPTHVDIKNCLMCSLYDLVRLLYDHIRLILDRQPPVYDRNMHVNAPATALSETFTFTGYKLLQIILIW